MGVIAFDTRYLAHNVLYTASCLGVSLRTDPPLTIEKIIGAGDLGAVAHNLVFTPVKMGANAIPLERRSITYQSWYLFIVWHDVPSL